MNIDQLIEAVYSVEGFTIEADASGTYFDDYFKGEWGKEGKTVADWKIRFKKKYPNVSFVVVQKGNGEIASGKMLLSNVRAGYSLPSLRKEIDGLKQAVLWWSEQAKSDSKPSDPYINPYEVLELEPGCDFDDVRAAYQRLRGAFHEDKLRPLGLNEKVIKLATQRLQEINAAYEQLREENEKLSQAA